MFRHPHRILILTQFSVALPAAMGLDVIAAASRRPRGTRDLAAVGASIACALVLGTYLVRQGNFHAAFGIGTAAVILSGVWNGRVVRTLVAAIALVELLLVSPRSQRLPYGPAAIGVYRTYQQTYATLAATQGSGRVWIVTGPLELAELSHVASVVVLAVAVADVASPDLVAALLEDLPERGSYGSQGSGDQDLAHAEASIRESGARRSAVRAGIRRSTLRHRYQRKCRTRRWRRISFRRPDDRHRRRRVAARCGRRSRRLAAAAAVRLAGSHRAARTHRVKPDSPVHYYVYYRIAAPHAAAARGVIEAVLRALEDRAGIVGRLLQGIDEPLLWMEVYENVRNPERFEAILGDLLAARRFTAFLAPGSERRIERFVAPSP